MGLIRHKKGVAMSESESLNLFGEVQAMPVTLPSEPEVLERAVYEMDPWERREWAAANDPAVYSPSREYHADECADPPVDIPDRRKRPRSRKGYPVARDARHKLGALEGKRLRFQARVERRSEKPAYRGFPIPTLLLRGVSLADTGDEVADHLWFTAGKWAEGLRLGDLIEFDARVDSYVKGYRGHRDDVHLPEESSDWHLERPTRVAIVELGRGQLCRAEKVAL